MHLCDHVQVGTVKNFLRQEGPDWVRAQTRGTKAYLEVLQRSPSRWVTWQCETPARVGRVRQLERWEDGPTELVGSVVVGVELETSLAAGQTLDRGTGDTSVAAFTQAVIEGLMVRSSDTLQTTQLWGTYRSYVSGPPLPWYLECWEAWLGRKSSDLSARSTSEPAEHATS